ncbi:MAG: PD-(D/E)XK nuclease family protein, partial [Candidatus Methanomethyliaceae archaeon]
RGILPPEIEGKVEGRLFSDERTLARWRNSQVGARYFDQELGALLYGALDDCLVDGDYLIPVDYKTRGYALKKESSSYYQHQLDIYCFLLKKEGYKVRDYAYLVYYIPTKAAENGVIHFHVQLEKADTDPCRGYELFCSAVKVLKGPEPEPEKNCEYCNWGSKAFARRRAQSDNAVMGGEEVRASAVQDRLF